MNSGGCTNCGQTTTVTVGGKVYCANCGLPMAAAAPAPIAATPPPPPIPPTRVAPRAVMSDVKRQMPTRSAPAGRVIDLRQMIPTPPPPPPPPPAPVLAPVARQMQRDELARTTTQSAQVTKFAPTPAVAVAPTQALPNAAASAHQSMQQLVNNLPAEPAPVLPSVSIAPTALATVPKSVRSRGSLIAAGLIIAALGSYVWFTNYPKMAVKIAGSRAGLEASWPAFLPASYRLSGAVAYGSGEVSYKLSSPTSDAQLTITQRQTSWDSKSLLENYVKTRSQNPEAVPGQGLTVYLFEDKAAWVNHGVWYTLEGTSKLSQEQILKIVYSL